MLEAARLLTQTQVSNFPFLKKENLTIPILARSLVPLLQIFDMPASISFYRDVLGFEVVASDGPLEDAGWVLLRLGNIELMLNTAYELRDRPAATDPARVAAHNDTALYFSCPDVDAVYRHLCAKGINGKEPLIAPYFIFRCI